MVGLTLMHLSLLHVDGSTNPLAVSGVYDFIPFYPYFLVKDVFGFLVFLALFSYLVFFDPNLLGHPDNYIRANPLVTPSHIVPEWYFLPFYAILRAVPSKLGGVIAMAASIGILFLMPTLDRGNFYLVWVFQVTLQTLFFTDWWLFFYGFILFVCTWWELWFYLPFFVWFWRYIFPKFPFFRPAVFKWPRYIFPQFPSTRINLNSGQACTKGRFAPIFKLFFSF
jgi:quinol-cytochrome oxidoreductase complex cytochrome b subunit